MTDDPVLHHIRLRGAWAVEPDGTQVRHTRRFGWPTALDPTERVWLVGELTSGPATISVNGSHVGDVAAGEGRFAADISTRLLPRNELVISAASGAELGAVGLDVRRAASADG